MPNQYVRISTERGKWTQKDLLDAIDAVVVRNVSVRQASIEYGVPRKTLERRLKTSNFSKGPMGPSSVFGEEHEKRMVRHILKMQEKSFPLTGKDLRSIAYYFAEQLQLNHSFNKDKETAGYVWLKSFLRRNPEIRIRKSEGVSLARCEALNREEVNAYYDILYQLLEEYELFDKPSHIFNMDESGFQLNNRPGHVLAKKGSKAVSTVTSTEKGETITVIACCNAEGVFLPPACIMKGKNKKQEWQDGMPPGSVLYMSQKSAYINAAIFLEWLKTHFLPRKPPGKVLLCLDGHTSHCNSVEMLEFAAANDICLFTLPSHTTHYLQTLDRSVFKSLKAHYYETCRIWLKRNPGRRLTRLQFGELLSTAWGKGATYENATAGFKATGVNPFNRYAVPDYAFAATDADMQNEEARPLRSSRDRSLENSTQRRYSSPSVLDIEQVNLNLDLETARRDNETQPRPSILEVERKDLGFGLEPSRRDSRTPSLPDMDKMNQPGPSGVVTARNICTPVPEEKIQKQNQLSPSRVQFAQNISTPKRVKKPEGENQCGVSKSQTEDKEETPSKFLNEISPIPTKTYPVRKRAKQVATILTSEEHIKRRKECDEKKNKTQLKSDIKKGKKIIKQEKTEESNKMKKIAKKRSKSNDMEDKILQAQKKIKQERISKSLNKKKKPQQRKESTETEDDEEPILLESGDSSPDDNIDDCVGCGVNYYETELTEDWIQCCICNRWTHENCTEYDDKCHPCGNKMKIEARKGKGKGKKTKKAE